MGQSRHFERARATSAYHPLADISLRRSAARRPTGSWRDLASDRFLASRSSANSYSAAMRRSHSSACLYSRKVWRLASKSRRVLSASRVSKPAAPSRIIRPFCSQTIRCASSTWRRALPRGSTSARLREGDPLRRRPRTVPESAGDPARVEAFRAARGEGGGAAFGQIVVFHSLLTISPSPRWAGFSTDIAIRFIFVPPMYGTTRIL